jgi:hypothetical protein
MRSNQSASCSNLKKAETETLQETNCFRDSSAASVTIKIERDSYPLGEEVTAKSKASTSSIRQEECDDRLAPVDPDNLDLVLNLEGFLGKLGLISQVALQRHLSQPKKVERRRRAVTANPRYTSNGFVEIGQLVMYLKCIYVTG